MSSPKDLLERRALGFAAARRGLRSRSRNADLPRGHLRSHRLAVVMYRRVSLAFWSQNAFNSMASRPGSAASQAARWKRVVVLLRGPTHDDVTVHAVTV